jgi:hypothetical protein
MRRHFPRRVKPYYAPLSTREVADTIDRAFQTHGPGLWRVMGAKSGWTLERFTEWLFWLDKRETLAVFHIAQNAGLAERRA